MDVFSHSLWGYGLFGYRGRPRLALLFGALPDLSSFGILTVLHVVTGSFAFGPPPLDTIPAWTLSIYDFTHSVIVAVVVIAIVHTRRKDISFPMLAWLFHIFLDIPFHTSDYFPTKMFWPLTDFFVDGFSWSTRWVFLSNLTGLLIIFCYRLLRSKSPQINLGG